MKQHLIEIVCVLALISMILVFAPKKQPCLIYKNGCTIDTLTPFGKSVNYIYNLKAQIKAYKDTINELRDPIKQVQLINQCEDAREKAHQRFNKH
jgi:hypothetical protein